MRRRTLAVFICHIGMNSIRSVRGSSCRFGIILAKNIIAWWRWIRSITVMSMSIMSRMILGWFWISIIRIAFSVRISIWSIMTSFIMRRMFLTIISILAGSPRTTRSSSLSIPISILIRRWIRRRIGRRIISMWSWRCRWIRRRIRSIQISTSAMRRGRRRIRISFSPVVIHGWHDRIGRIPFTAMIVIVRRRISTTTIMRRSTGRIIWVFFLKG